LIRAVRARRADRTAGLTGFFALPPLRLAGFLAAVLEAVLEAVFTVGLLATFFVEEEAGLVAVRVDCPATSGTFNEKTSKRASQLTASREIEVESVATFMIQL
jgi:hypothetical protein